MLNHLLESQHREELSGLGFLGAGGAEVCLKSIESTEGGGTIGLVFWKVLGTGGIVTMRIKVVRSGEVGSSPHWDS
jgi:hypothetical protein